YSYYVWTYGITCYTQLNGDVNLANDTLKGTIEVTNLIDDFEHGIERWVSDYGWGLASPSHSGNYGIFNRVLPNCTNKIETHLTSTFRFDLSSLTSAELRFWTRYSFLENDSGFVEISSDSGKIWHRIGNTLVGKNLDYCLKTYSLSSYCGVGYNDIQIRFTVYNDLSNVVPAWYIDDITIHPNEETGVRSQVISTSPAIYVLYNNYPNPFNSQTIIKYQLPRATDVKIVIYNLRGQQIKTLIDKRHQAGTYEIIWDGLDFQGLPVTSGIYFYALITDENVQVRKMTFIK
ncbi:MAG: T9SS type A sorting domain-containing protein, partial [bacterium]